MTNEQKNSFSKYVLRYSRSSQKQELIELQKHIYEQLNYKSIEETAVKELVNFINEDIKNQYSFKQDIENKTGFLIALWGLLIASIFETQIINTLIANIINTENSIFYIVINIFFLLGLSISTLFELVEIILVFHTSEYSQVPYDDKNTYYRAAVDDKNMFWVRTLEVSTNVWKKNNNTNEEKYEHFMRAVYGSGSLAVFFIICNCI